MRAVVQRVSFGKVEVEKEIVGSINKGLVVLLGVGEKDTENESSYMAEKIANLRIFEDNTGKLNLSIKDIAGEVLAISQFTLYADCRKGRRPSFSSAADPEKANNLYREFVESLKKEHNIKVETGTFGELMNVSLENNGPVTILLDSEKLF